MLAPFKTLMVLTLIACSMSSCEWLRRSQAQEAREFSRFQESTIHSASRIVIMPLYLDKEVGASAAVMDSNLIRSMGELNHFELLRASSDDRDSLFEADPLRSNRLSQNSLRQTRETFGADAVIIGRINHWQSYDPVAVGLTISMVDCRDGSVLWSATGMWDSGRRATQDDIKEWYYNNRGAGNAVIGGWQTLLSSPSAFTRYVSDRLAASVLSRPEDPR